MRRSGSAFQRSAKGTSGSSACTTTASASNPAFSIISSRYSGGFTPVKNMRGAAWGWRSAAGSLNVTAGASGWIRRSVKERHSTSHCRREEQAMSDEKPDEGFAEGLASSNCRRGEEMKNEKLEILVI